MVRGVALLAVVVISVIRIGLRPSLTRSLAPGGPGLAPGQGPAGVIQLLVRVIGAFLPVIVSQSVTDLVSPGNTACYGWLKEL